MKIVFEDQFGFEGRIMADLSVDYEGRWREEVESVVDELEAGAEADPRGSDLGAVHQEVMLELPEEIPVTEIERRYD